MQLTERELSILELKMSGATFRQIGQKYNISYGRAFNIFTHARNKQKLVNYRNMEPELKQVMENVWRCNTAASEWNNIYYALAYVLADNHIVTISQFKSLDIKGISFYKKDKCISPYIDDICQIQKNIDKLKKDKA